MAGYEFRPAVRDKTSVLIALAGASGSGKTYTAVLLAVGLAYPGMDRAQILATIAEEGQSRIFFIDSEGGRGRHYAPGSGQDPDFVNTFPYQYGEIRAPYTPENYRDAALAAEAAGAWVIIIDSMSHEYESEGGIMEIADQIEAGVLKPGKTIEDTQDRQNGWKAWDIKPVKSPGNWKEPKTRHKKMVNRMIQCRAHLIFCLRAEEKMLMERKPKLDRDGNQQTFNGKPQFETVIIPAEDRPLLERWAPICEKRFMYEMTASFLLVPSEPGVGHPIKNLQAQFRPFFPPGKHLGIANGQALAEWSMGKNGGRPSGAAAEAGQDPPEKSKATMTPRQWLDAYSARIRGAVDLEAMMAIQQTDANVRAIAKLRDTAPDLHTEVMDLHAARYAELSPSTGDEAEGKEGLFDDD